MRRADPGRLGAAGLGTDQRTAVFGGGHRGGQGADHGNERTVERQFAKRHRLRHVLLRDHADGRQQRERDGQVEMRAFLGQVGGRQVHGDLAGRQGDGHGGQRRAHPVARLAHRLVRQADDGKGGHAGGQGALHLDGPRLDPFERHGIGACDHAAPSEYG